jgi:hypothetical protein
LAIDDPQLQAKLLCNPGEATLERQWPKGTRVLSVVCGPLDGKTLSAVIVRSTGAWKTAWELNPGFSDTVMTAWPNGRIFWFWIDGFVRRNLNRRGMTWFSLGLVPLCTSNSRYEECVKQGSSIPVRKFSELHWEERTGRIFEEDEIIARFGAPFREDPSGRLVLNDLYSAEIFSRWSGLMYDLQLKSFRHKEAGKWRVLSTAEVIQLVARQLEAVAANFPKFPRSEINMRGIRQLISRLQVKTAVEPPAERSAVEQFLTEAVLPTPGGKILSEQIRQAFVLYCTGNELPICSDDFFFKAVSAKLGPSSHCFGENNGKRGRVGWRLNWDVIHSEVVENKVIVLRP